MEEAELCSTTRFVSHLREESGDEELSVLPRHTKVIVTGNNRTKSVLLGLQGVVKKAVGLGGWHWLVLKNGIEVKLQRNALSVVEHPAGNEVEDDADLDSSGGSEIGAKDHYPSSEGELLLREMKPLMQPSSAKSAISSKHRNVSSVPINVQKARVNLDKLGTKSLRRYCSHYRIAGINADSSREQMINAVQRHFETQPPLDDLQVLADLNQTLKKRHK